MACISEFNVCSEGEMLRLGESLARTLTPPCIIYLQGNLGAGKTTLVRGILTALGHNSNVKSPTYTLVESYRLGELACYHFDLYRLGDPEELETIGFRDYLQSDSLCFVEWTEKGGGWLPEPDLLIWLEAAAPGERRVVCKAMKSAGEQILEKLKS
jgi:tRNA threonylcarbamoyladenosine biosynthesis protein TsaE